MFKVQSTYSSVFINPDRLKYIELSPGSRIIRFRFLNTFLFEDLECSNYKEATEIMRILGMRNDLLLVDRASHYSLISLKNCNSFKEFQHCKFQAIMRDKDIIYSESMNILDIKEVLLNLESKLS